MPYRDRMDIPHKFLELCKYQQDIIKQYETYIEKYIHAEIIKEDCSRKSPFEVKELVAKRITIPETTIMLLCEPWAIDEWNWLKAQTPLISPDYFINIAYQEQEERKSAKTD